MKRKPPLAINVRRIRRERNLSQFKLAERAGLDRTTVAIIEANSRPGVTPRPETIQAIADALGVAVRTLTRAA
jgi:transcriptional regulator with XRE-family HTH domain